MKPVFLEKLNQTNSKLAKEINATVRSVVKHIDKTWSLCLPENNECGVNKDRG